MRNARPLQSLSVKEETVIQKDTSTKNRCWFDAEPCPSRSEVKGLQDFNGSCVDCSRLDKEKLFVILEKMSLLKILIPRIELEDISAWQKKINETKEELKEEVEEEVKGEAKREGRREMCSEVSEYLRKLACQQ